MVPAFLLRRTHTPSCFYCLSPVALDARAFRCPHCGCWNRYDADGEIVSDDPAMHDETLNAASFARRASPNKDRLPPTYPKGPFCRACQTNQMLLVNLLSNYLPPPQHPDYAQRLEQLPAYRESLHVRYPPVCANCLPAVEDEIEQKNQMARTKALGGWLRESKGRERQRLVPRSAKDRGTLQLQLVVWRLRGVLWHTTLLSVILAYAAAIKGCEFPRSLARSVPVLPALCLFSLLYAAWDPTYHRFKEAKAQGRDIRIKGRPCYIILQALSWLSRLTTSILLFLSWKSSSWDYLRIATYPSSSRVRTYCLALLVLELLVFSSSFTILHLQRPPAIRLIEPSTRSSSVCETPASSARASPMPAAPVINEPDLLASLTLSSNPLVSATNPMFGRPSLVTPVPASTASGPSPIEVDETVDEDAMDWTPTNPSPVKVKRATDDDGTWLRPQRFFPPERPTGLESLFANTNLVDRDAPATARAIPKQGGLGNVKAIGWWMSAITVIVVCLGIAVQYEWTRRWIP